MAKPQPKKGDKDQVAVNVQVGTADWSQSTKTKKSNCPLGCLHLAAP
jgi:hypothetical protein